MKRILITVMVSLTCTMSMFSRSTLTHTDTVASIFSAFNTVHNKYTNDAIVYDSTSGFSVKYINGIAKVITPNQRKEVGQINITSGISPTGAKTYNVPINVYTANGCLSPSLSLTYNSQQGNGILGMGWSLSGLQTIARTSNVPYYDGRTRGIRLDHEDGFTLNGMRMIKIADGPEPIYQTEQGNVKAKAHVSGNAILYFEVFFTDGSKGIFGFTDNSENRLFYPLTLLTDSKNNIISYKYHYYNNHYNIESINYANASVVFEYTENTIYDSRTDFVSAYACGLDVTEERRLWTITCKYGSKEICKYTLGFQENLYKSFLSTIRYSCSGKEINEINFGSNIGYVDYTYETTTSILPNDYSSIKRGSIIQLIGRFSPGSSNSVIVTYSNKNPYKLIKNNHGSFFINGYADDKEYISVNTKLDGEKALGGKRITVGQFFVCLLRARLNNKNEDIIVKINNKDTNGNETVTLQTYTCTSTGNLTNQTTKTYNLYGNKKIQPKSFFSGDFNGDGEDEILAVSSTVALDPKQKSKCYLFGIENNGLLYDGSAFDYTLDYSNGSEDPTENSDCILPIDFDGDGKTDICLINNSGIHYYSFEPDGSRLLLKHISSYNSINKKLVKARKLLLGDFNGDGLADIFLSQSTDNLQSRSSFLCISKGNGDFLTKEINLPYYRSKNDEFFLQDIDGDGFSDIIHMKDNEFHTYMIKNVELKRSFATKLPNTNAILTPVSINSKNNNSQLIAITGNQATKYSFLLGDREEWLVTMMSNSNGIIERNDYHTIGLEKYTITPDEGVYTPGTNASFPYANIYDPIHVLSSTKTSFGDNTISSKKFNYHNAVLHRQGLGFIGFEQINFTDERGDTHNAIYNVYGRGELLSEKDNKKVCSYSYENKLNNKTLQIRLVNKKETNFVTQQSTETKFEYDEYGNTTTEKNTLNDGSTITKRYVYLNNNNIAGTYHIGTLIGESTETTRNGDTYKVETIANGLNNKLLPVSIKQLTNNNIVQTRTFEYDGRGNIIKETTIPFTSTNAMVNTYTYDSQNRLLTSTDPFNQTTEYEYDDFGRLSQMTDPLGNNTSYEYDAMGRLISTTYPDGTALTTEYKWVQDDNTGGLYSVTDRMTGSSATITEYDALNRETRSGRMQTDGKWLWTTKIYDNYGRLQAESRPGKDGAAKQWNKYEYDAYDRAILYTNFRGKTVKYNYEKDVISISDGHTTTTKKLDAFGHVTEIHDEGGTVTFDLRADGKPTKINAAGAITNITYDTYGRRSSIEPVAIGKITYQYSTNGELSNETNAKGETIEYAYDNKNRLIRRSTPEFTTYYKYDNNNRTTSVTSSNGTSKRYTYDQYGRTESITEKANDNVMLEKCFSYADGNVCSIKYSSHNGLLGTVNYVYSNGTLCETNLNGTTPIFKLNTEDSYGQTTKITTGPITRYYGYSDTGMPISRSTNGFNKNIQQLTYTYAPQTGLMLSRINHNATANKNETFEYDAIGRLTKYADNTIKYSENGNILQKNDYGEFSYRLDNPYAPNTVRLTPEATLFAFPQDIETTSFNRPKSISNENKIFSFTYNADYDMVCMRMSGKQKPSLSNSRYYLGRCYEAESGYTTTATSERLYLDGNYYDATTVLIRKNGIDSIYYILRDNIGSITDIVSSDGQRHYRQDYDVWGKPREIENKESQNTATQGVYHFLNRGYCGHEHLIEMDVINMNARLYDPSMGKFLSPDPNVANPYMSQAYNRYIYAMNNPLMYVDRDGENPFVALGMIVGGAYLGGVIANDFNFNPLKWDFNSWSTYAGIVGGGVFVYSVTTGFAAGNISLAMRVSTPYATVGMETWQSYNGINMIGYYSTIAGGMATSYDKSVEENVSNAINGYILDYPYYQEETVAYSNDISDIGIYDERIIPYNYSEPSTTLYFTEIELTNKKVKEIVTLKKGKRNEKPGYVYFLKPKKDGFYKNVRTGNAVYLTTKDIWKIGESTVDQRYRPSTYEYVNFNKEKVYFGKTKTEIKVMEKIYIYDYVLKNGVLPPGNRIFR